MTSNQRIYGPVLTDLATQSVFAGSDETKRMDVIRSKITEIRSIWHDTTAYEKLRDQIQNLIYNDKHTPELQAQIKLLLTGFNDWADIDYNRPDGIKKQGWTAIELYCSKEGYDYLFGLFNTVLRTTKLDLDKLLTAVTLVELLTIELYNLRLMNIGDPKYANYQGKTFRGMRVSRNTVEDFRKVATNADVSKRHFSIPLGFISSSTTSSTMEEFARGHPSDDQMHWTIHIHGLNPKLLRIYEEKYKESVVTSICAMPVATIAEFGEKEILLRGAFFHIIKMSSKEVDGRMIHIIEMAMLNSNRDHGTELALHEGEKKVQRDFFRDMCLASRYELCASLTKPYSTEDSEEYERLAKAALQRIEATNHTSSMYDSVPIGLRSWSTPTWLGDTTGQSFPRNYLSLRQKFHKAAREGHWPTVREILEREYDWRKAEWFNVATLLDNSELPSDGHTLLHDIAAWKTPSHNNPECLEAWNYLLDELGKCEAWRTLRTLDDAHETAEDIARAYGHHDLVQLLKPRTYRQIPFKALNALEVQLHNLIREHAGNYIDGLAFRMPQLSVLTEISEPELWVPIPQMYGGFLIILQEQTLRVSLFQTILGETKTKRTEFELQQVLQINEETVVE